MNSVRLTNLDELILTVRDKTSYSYILEAVSAYRGGAYRAAIVATWIAVSYDIISKIKELAGQDDKQASDFIDKLNKAIKNKEILTLQRIEEDLLNDAFREDNGFGFLLQHEYIDLKRLKEDRNLCAHPAFVAEEELFQPTPELVRTHIVHSIVHLLQHQPVQGKSAIKSVMSDVKGALFPQDLDIACRFVNDKYLNRAKQSFVRNLIDVLVKTLLKNNESDFDGKENAIVNTLIAISRKHPQIYEERMEDKLSRIFDSLEENKVGRIFRLLNADLRCWNWLTENNKIRIQEFLAYVEQRPFKVDKQKRITESKVFGSLVIPELQSLLIAIFKKLDYRNRIYVIEQNPNPVFTEEAIEIYSSASSYDNSATLGKNVLIPMAKFFTGEQINKILKVVRTNDQIYDASGTPKVVEKLFDLTIDHLGYTKQSWQELLNFFHKKEFFDEDDDSVYSSWGYPSLLQKLESNNIFIEK